eukprot:scaffold78701_cov37-Tisochrysis_lutea.AAC.1
MATWRPGPLGWGSELASDYRRSARLERVRRAQRLWESSVSLWKSAQPLGENMDAPRSRGAPLVRMPARIPLPCTQTQTVDFAHVERLPKEPPKSGTCGHECAPSRTPAESTHQYSRPASSLRPGGSAYARQTPVAHARSALLRWHRGEGEGKARSWKKSIVAVGTN